VIIQPARQRGWRLRIDHLADFQVSEDRMNARISREPELAVVFNRFAKPTIKQKKISHADVLFSQVAAGASYLAEGWPPMPAPRPQTFDKIRIEVRTFSLNPARYAQLVDDLLVGLFARGREILITKSIEHGRDG
jgi:hypothetical protein